MTMSDSVQTDEAGAPGRPRRFDDQLISLNTPQVHDGVVALGVRFGVSQAEAMRTILRLGLPLVEDEFRRQGMEPLMSKAKSLAEARRLREQRRTKRAGGGRQAGRLAAKAPVATFQAAA